jgi:hypothetical protein
LKSSCGWPEGSGEDGGLKATGRLPLRVNALHFSRQFLRVDHGRDFDSAQI